MVDKFCFPEVKVDQIINFIGKNCEILTFVPLSKPICSDPGDNNIFASVVSGNEDLLVLKNFQGIPIVRPCDFWRFEKKRTGV